MSGYGYGYGLNKYSYSSGYINTETTAYINATSSSSTYGSVVDLLITDLKTYGLWDKMVFGMLSPITLDDTLSVVDLKTAVVLSGAAIKGTTDTGTRATMTTPLPTGINMKQSGDYVKTGAIPTTLHTVNSTCIAHGVLENVAGGTKYYYSSFQGASNSFQGNLRSAGNSAIIDSYANVGNAGRNTLGGGTVTDVSGRWIHNRRSATDVELYRNGVSVGTAANGGGALPNIEMFLGAQNSAGTPANYGNHKCTYHLEFSGLTATERNNLETTMSSYESNLGSLRSLTRNLVWDGNSISVYDNWGQVRKSLYYAYNTSNKLYRTNNVSVAGQTTSDMLADYAAQVAPLYSGSYTKNIYIIDEIRNDIYLGASTTTAKQNLTDLVTAAKATGWTVVVRNVRFSNYSGNTGRTETQFNLAMDEMATYITSNSFGADYIVEVTSPILWDARSNYASDAAYNSYIATQIANTDYYTDGTHPAPEYARLTGYDTATQALNLIG